MTDGWLVYGEQDGCQVLEGFVPSKRLAPEGKILAQVTAKQADYHMTKIAGPYYMDVLGIKDTAKVEHTRAGVKRWLSSLFWLFGK